ncbi:DUF4142 domain-containing protein [Nonomuraea sp. NPDC050536]|uniref:DUF4142 domain-containing protein n=1 Tax=Nonomuraea sp. NPDC050536 TaxID=3364366 RepID=UPI0037C605AD
MSNLSHASFSEVVMSLRSPCASFVAIAAVAVTVMASGLSTAAAAEVSAQDRQFLRQAHQGNLTEIAAGKLAQDKGKADVVRAIGAKLVADHTKLDVAVKATARRLQVSLPAGPSAHQKAVGAKLAALSGSAFDQAWVAVMIEGHRMALQMGQRQVQTGTAAAAKQAAESSAPIIQGHLDRLLEAQQTLGMPSAVPAGDGGQAQNNDMAGVGYGGLAAGLLLALAGGLIWIRPRWRRR